MPAVTSEDFFKEQEEHSRIKACIVTDYFWAWAQVMIGVQNRYAGSRKLLAYVDLFAGPGKYDDGSESTPLMIMRTALEKLELCERLVTIFNDKDERNTAALRAAISALPGIEKLKHPPQLYTSEVDESLVRYFEGMRHPPTLLFVDPFGYKGLSLRLIRSFLKDFGCDCVFFFNYNRINSGINNAVVLTHMQEIFGVERAAQLQQRFMAQSARPIQREALIVDEMKTALEEMGGQYVLPFRFRSPDEARTSHHLFFVSKDFLGYSIMREIMRKHSHDTERVAKFEYNPTDASIPSLFELLRPLDDLEDMLLKDCAGTINTINSLFKSHSKGKPFVLKEYKEVLCLMEKAGKVTMDPPHEKRRKDTLGEKVKIKFPRREQ